MKTKTYKVCDTCDCLVIGGVYDAVPAGRMVRFTNVSTGVTLHLFPHDVVRGLSRGALVELDDTQSQRMHAESVTKLCHMLASHYIY